MEGTLLQFAALLRAAGLRVSTGEVVDSMHAATAVALRDRETLKVALGVTLVKDAQDWPIYSDLYDRFFHLRPLPQTGPVEHEHGHDDLRDELLADRVTLSEEPAPTPQAGHDHGKPTDIRDYFDERDLASSYNLHQAANKIDMASMTPEVVLANQQRTRRHTGGAATAVGDRPAARRLGRRRPRGGDRDPRRGRA